MSTQTWTVSFSAKILMKIKYYVTKRVAHHKYIRLEKLFNMKKISLSKYILQIKVYVEIYTFNLALITGFTRIKNLYKKFILITHKSNAVAIAIS